MKTTAAIKAIATAFPTTVRTNDYWRTRVPEVIEMLERKAATQVWEADPEEPSLWTETMAPYLDDVFRGSVERRVMTGNERVLDFEVRAAKRCLAEVKLSPSDVDLVLITSLFPDQLVFGNGVFFAEAMGMSCPCWNLESACGSALADLLTAASFIESGRANNVLVVISCGYSRALPDTSPMSWTSADGAAAILLSRGHGDEGILGSKVVATPETIPAFTWGVKDDPVVQQTITFATTKVASALLGRSAAQHLPRCADAALAASGMTRADIDFAIFPTPAAWFAEFGRRTLGLRPDQTIDTYPRLSNTGPVLSPQNLYFAAREGHVKPGDRVLFVAQGSMSSCGSLVLQWGDVAIAPDCDA
jgi:3-oxoacyl-[acyl-carrier-protein] synthase-3